MHLYRHRAIPTLTQIENMMTRPELIEVIEQNVYISILLLKIFLLDSKDLEKPLMWCPWQWGDEEIKLLEYDLMMAHILISFLSTTEMAGDRRATQFYVHFLFLSWPNLPHFQTNKDVKIRKHKDYISLNFFQSGWTWKYFIGNL